MPKRGPFQTRQIIRKGVPDEQVGARPKPRQRSRRDLRKRDGSAQMEGYSPPNPAFCADRLRTQFANPPKLETRREPPRSSHTTRRPRPRDENFSQNLSWLFGKNRKQNIGTISIKSVCP